MLTTRRATLADVDDVVALVESAYRGEASRAGWTTEADLLDGRRTDAAMVREVIEASGTVLLLGHDGGELVACCVVEDRRDVAPGEAYVGMLAVRPGRQGGGIGAAMLAAAEAHARDLGASTLRLTVIVQRDELIAWYERRGFVRTEEREPFPYGDERFGIPRRDDLEFLVMRKALRATT